ncbi:MAG TPA: fumarylacetoacetate hydrolase family protein [Skermanella sp.]|jgi:2-keto-4-pentenoate hydratase|nr:fumarylacetoacetate hydrolase family protein [Skermanella sp.]
MTPIELAAASLLEARRTGTRLDALPEGSAPADTAAAYAIQDRVMVDLRSELGGTAGWKVGSKGTTDQPLCAPMPSGLFQGSPGSLRGADFKTRIIEAEVAFHIAADLPPIGRAYETEDLIDAIDYIVPAIEVVESRYVNFKALERMSVLADSLSNGGFIHGEPVHDWRGLDLENPVAALVVDGAVTLETKGGNPAGDLMRLVVWLANHVAGRTGGLRAGDFVTTGSFIGMQPVGPSADVEIRLSGVGNARVRFM